MKIYLPSDPQGYMAAWIDKIALLRGTPSPRILLVGGSNLTFGIDSGMLSSATGLPVVNSSLHAGYGLDVNLNLVKPYIRNGDIILLVPEYEYFNNSDEHTRGGVPTLAALLDAYPPVIFSFSDPQLDRLPEILSAVVKIRHERYLALKKVDFDQNRYNHEIRGTVYLRDQFNQYGDEIGHLNIQSNPFPLNQIMYLGSKVGNQRVIYLLENFEKYAQSKGAKIIYFFPYGRKYNCDLSQTGLEELYQFITDHFQFTTVSTPLNNCVSNDLFFDTNYHLTKTGRELRSIRMVDELDLLLSNDFLFQAPSQDIYQPLKIIEIDKNWSICLNEVSLLECANLSLDDSSIRFTPYGESSFLDFTTQILYHTSDHQITIVTSRKEISGPSSQRKEYRFDFEKNGGQWELTWAGIRNW